ncbi:MAG TPA: isocitrate lyase/PEP mutase family protein [Gemmatimonadales bacterium]|nr:isocitrate lyase/PEP mutase family protein [Gemmatimonadales bacterium]
MSGVATLRGLLGRGEQLVAPGVYDPLSAKAVLSLGFNGLDLGGFATAAVLGTLEPVMTMTEQVDAARRIVQIAGDTPVIADGHTGFGDAVQIWRAVREFEDAGVAAIHIEDQIFPKQAGYHRNEKYMIPAEEMEQRIRTACRARRKDLVIIARTDARGAVGGSLEETIARARAYYAAGADVIMPMPYGADEAAVMRESVPDIPLAWVGGLGKFAPGDEVPLPVLKSLEYQIVMYGVIGLVEAINAVVRLYDGLRDSGVVDVSGLGEGYERIMELVGAPEYYEVERTSGVVESV